MQRHKNSLAFLTVVVAFCTADPIVWGPIHSGGYNLGPVDWSESQFHNACAPPGGYQSPISDLEGAPSTFLAGVDRSIGGDGSMCDSCIFIKTSQTGRSLVARVVTYGTSQSAGDLDLSPEAYSALNTGEWPRPMTWQLSACPSANGPLRYHFQTGSSIWWTSLWIRNPYCQITMAEVLSASHSSWFRLSQNTDGTYNDAGGFGSGQFSIRVTGVNGVRVTDTFPSFTPGGILVGSSNFDLSNTTTGSGTSTNDNPGLSGGGIAAIVIFVGVLPACIAAAIVVWVVIQKRNGKSIIPEFIKKKAPSLPGPTGRV